MASTSPPPSHMPPPRTPKRRKPLIIINTPHVHKGVTQEFSQDAADKMKDVYTKICLESSGHYHVGMDPEDFLNEFLPWNDETPNNYKEKKVSKLRTEALLSVPPRKGTGDPENSMYAPFVKALDKWVRQSELKRLKIRKAKSLRFLRADIPDTSCNNLNVDVSTYWEDELLQDERQSSEEREEGIRYCMSFARQQTHEEFKPTLIHDAFQHELDEGRHKGKKKAKETKGVKVGDVNEDDGTEGDGGNEVGEEGQGDYEEEEGKEEAGMGEGGEDSGEVDDEGNGNIDNEEKEEIREDTDDEEEEETEDTDDEEEEETEDTDDEEEEETGDADDKQEEEMLDEEIGEATGDVYEEETGEVHERGNEENAKDEDAAAPVGHVISNEPQGLLDAKVPAMITLPEQAVPGLTLTDTELGIHTRGQITAYAGLALSMNFRKHFFSMLILGPYARFIRWDRRGAIVTYRFDYTKRPELIFEFYRRYGQLKPIQRGFDPSVTRCALPQTVVAAFARYRDRYGGADFSAKPRGTTSERQHGFCVKVSDTSSKVTESFYVPPPRYSRACLMPFSRATKRSLACRKGKGTKPQVCFMKDSWQEVSSRAVREAEIYRMLKAANVEHVASMRLGGDVEDMETESQVWLGRKFGKMVCHRLILETVARSLSTFTWCKVLLSCIADAVEAAQQAYKAGILHRDLSAGNIMIVRDGKTREWRGLLIDWDMCLLLENRDGETRSGRTGTWAFMSSHIQSTQGPYTHTLCDDLESAFWVLLYHALLYTKHNLSPNDLSQLLNAIFSSHVRQMNGSVTGGREKENGLARCALKASARGIARFEIAGLNDLLNELGAVLYHRYDENADDKPSEDLNEAENTWMTGVLRKTALNMAPLSVTPTALESPTNDSEPPDDPNMWKNADLKTQDYHAMPWVSDPHASTKMQVNQFDRITSSMIHHLDGSSSKRLYIQEVDEDYQEDKPAHKKQRQESPSPQSRRSQRLNHVNPMS